MLLLASLAPFVVVAARVAASSIRDHSSLISVPIIKNISSASTLNFVRYDIERSTFFLNRGKHHISPRSEKAPDVPLIYNPAMYMAEIGIGDPQVYYRLIVDTGSSNTWVGAEMPYVKTKTSIKTSDSFEVTYGRGQVNGTEYIDAVTIASGVTIPQQYIGATQGVAPNALGFKYFDGILGIGPRNLTLGTTFPISGIIPTVTDNLVQQGTIKQNIVATFFQPSNATSVINGELTFGDTDSTKYIGNITYHHLTKIYPASLYFGIDASFRYGDETLLETSPGIVDTGTSLIGLATDAYDRYVEATGAVYDNTTQLLRICSAQYSNLKPLSFKVGRRTYNLNANSQIIPRTLKSPTGDNKDAIYLAVFDLGPQLSNQLSFVVGLAFLERYYTVFDADRGRVGFATTQFTDATDIN